MNTLYTFLLICFCVSADKYVVTFKKYKDVNCQELDFERKYEQGKCYVQSESNEIDLQNGESFNVDTCFLNTIYFDKYNDNDCGDFGSNVNRLENNCYNGEKFSCKYKNKAAKTIGTTILILIIIAVVCCLICCLAALKILVCK